MLCSVYIALRDAAGATRAAENAVSAAESALIHDPTNGSALSTVVTGLGILQLRERAEEWIDRALLISPDNIFMRYNFACTTTLQFHDPEAAIKLLESVFPLLSASAYKAVVADPDLDALRDHPRFQELMEAARERLAADLPNPAAA
jgi:adenylate cyclase